MPSDYDILRLAYEREQNAKDKKLLPAWVPFEPNQVGATRDQVQTLIDQGFLTLDSQSRWHNRNRYKLTEKGRNTVINLMMERKMQLPDAATILEAMDLIVGFDDLKETIANSIATGKRVHFLLSGPPACAKSLVLDAVRTTVESSYMVFGSRTSASGLSEVLFEHLPTVLLMDELDKIHHDVYAVLLGLMETGEILETKSGKTRGIQLSTAVIGACNKYEKMPPEFLSRFALHAHFPHYNRDEFIEVCTGFLPRTEGCSVELAEMIAKKVYDYELGDTRTARSVCKLINEKTEVEVNRVIQVMMKYSTTNQARSKRQKSSVGERLL
jgi:Holliday junction resolvasome RuvABC ATP-dependent DNA helicase subunit